MAQLADRRLEGKTALITGAATGIGRAIAIRFAQEGANVAINYRNGPEDAAAAQSAVRASRCPDDLAREITVQADISQEEEVRILFAAVTREFGSIDIVVNNAGIQQATPSHQIEVADFDRVLNVNLRGAFLCGRRDPQ